MKKRILGLLLIMCMLVGQFSVVSANPSPKDEFDVITDGYEIEIQDDDEYLENIPDDKKPLSPVFNLTGEDSDDEHRVEFYVPDLNDNVKGPIYVYVTYEDGTTEVLEAVDVDYENKTVTFVFKSVPAKAVLFGEVVNLEAVGQAPKTGVMSTWGIWMVLAVVFAAAAFGFSRKKSA